MKIINILHKPTNTSYNVVVDDEDYEKVLACGSWYLAFGNCKTPYVANDRVGKLHRFIIGETNSSILIDHINRNTLDNRKSNLRRTDCSTNKKNMNTRIDNKFNMNGISEEKGSKPRIKCSWQESGRQKTKSFSINKYGRDEAIRLAKEYRIDMMKKNGYLLEEGSETIENQ